MIKINGKLIFWLLTTFLMGWLILLVIDFMSFEGGFTLLRNSFLFLFLCMPYTFYMEICVRLMKLQNKINFKLIFSILLLSLLFIFFLIFSFKPLELMAFFEKNEMSNNDLLDSIFYFIYIIPLVVIGFEIALFEKHLNKSKKIDIFNAFLYSGLLLIYYPIGLFRLHEVLSKILLKKTSFD